VEPRRDRQHGNGRRTAALGAPSQAAGAQNLCTRPAHFLDLLGNVLGARCHSLRHLTTTLFSAADWSAIVGIAAEILQAESAMFSAVQAAATPGFDLAQMSSKRKRG
jgi:hypothetical protein